MNQSSNPGNILHTNGTSLTLDDLAVMVKSGFDDIDQKMFTKDEAKEVEDRLNQKIMKESQATRDHVTKSSAEVGGASVQRDRTLNAKTDTVAAKLGERSIFTQTDVADIVRISPVAVAPTP